MTTSVNLSASPILVSESPFSLPRLSRVHLRFLDFHQVVEHLLPHIHVLSNLRDVVLERIVIRQCLVAEVIQPSVLALPPTSTHPGSIA